MVRDLGASLSSVLHRPLPEPPGMMRQGPLKEDAWRSGVRSERTAALLGTVLGIAFATCFVTGLISHYIQHPAGVLHWPSRPVNFYRVTQGLHVITGFAAVPLLLAKLWTVYPKLFEWPPVRSLSHAVGRLSLLVLVGAAIFQLVTGIVNVARWYAVFPFFFTVAHYWTAWIAIGAITVHVGTKLPIIARGLRRGGDPERVDARPGALSRRGFLTAVGVGTGVVVVTTAGQTVPALSAVTVFGQRDPSSGPQGMPVNKTATSARVTETAVDPAYRLSLGGGRQLSLADLQAMPQHTVDLPITCVEGWSAGATWTGVRVADLADLAGIPVDSDITVESLQTGGLYRASVLSANHARDPLTLLALQLDGQVLDLDHGFPVRLIAPNRPGVMQTKWVSSLAAVSS